MRQRRKDLDLRASAAPRRRRLRSSSSSSGRSGPCEAAHAGGAGRIANWARGLGGVGETQGSEPTARPRPAPGSGARRRRPSRWAAGGSGSASRVSTARPPPALRLSPGFRLARQPEPGLWNRSNVPAPPLSGSGPRAAAPTVASPRAVLVTEYVETESLRTWTD